MRELKRFSLERHVGEYADWPLRSRVFIDGAPSQSKIAGYQLLHQFETSLGYLLVSDCACPFEEATSFSLLDSVTLKMLSERTLSIPYGSYLLEELSWQDPLTARLRFWQAQYYLLRLVPPAGWFHRRAKLRLQRLVNAPT